MYHPINGGTQITLRYGGYKVWIPPKPSNSEIAGHHLKKSHQFFNRIELPDFWEERSSEEAFKRDKMIPLWESGQIKYHELFTDRVLEEFRRREWSRRKNGFWFYNDGVPVYITGTHYYYITWTNWDHSENNGFPIFYENQVDRFYFRGLCETDPNCLGYILLGPRGFGKSSEELGCLLDRSTQEPRQSKAYIQSNNDSSAQEFLFQQKLVPTFNKLPDFFKPVYDHGSSPKNELSFKRQSRLGEASKQVKYKPEFELLNIVTWASSKEKGLDAATAQDVMNDEIGKTPPHIAEVDKRIAVNREVVFRNSKKVGIIRATSTVEELEEGGAQCLKVWENSDPEKLTKNKQTISGLYRWFESIGDTDVEFANEFGKIDKDRVHPTLGVTVLEYHQSEREARKHDPDLFADWIRKKPMYESDMWTKKPGTTMFNTQRLQDYKNKLVIHQNLTVKGNFHFQGAAFKSKVVFERDDHAGRWELSVLLDDVDKNNIYGVSNAVNIGWSYEHNKDCIFPLNKSRFVLGVDPIKDVKTKDTRASKMSAHLKFKYNDNLDRGKKVEDWLSNRYVGRYCHRLERPEDCYLDVAMAMIYFGTWANIEKNVGDFHTYLKGYGMHDFIMTSYDFDSDASFQSKVNLDEPIQSTGAVQQAYINALRTGFANNIPERTNYLPFVSTIDQCIEFDPKNWTKFDEVVSLGYAELGDQAIVEEPFDHKKDGVEASSWFPLYDISGDEPVLVEDEMDPDDLPEDFRY